MFYIAVPKAREGSGCKMTQEMARGSWMAAAKHDEEISILS